MKKIGIITICDNDNYGNRLQNYALHKVIKELGFNNVTLWDKEEINLKGRTKFLIKKILSVKSLKYKRFSSFHSFTKNNIPNQYVNFNKISKISDRFSYFVVGSDQIWNYNFGHAKERDFLSFAPYEKTISYAPSFGVSNIDNEWKDKISKGISHIKYLSVRESKGAEIIKELTNRDAQVVLDPTLLLDRDEWYKIQKEPLNMIKEKYILTYFLGEISEEVRKQIEKLKIETGYKVINLYNKKEKDFYICGPAEFIYLFNNSELIFTDSFHACVFSIIFNKPFYVFERNTKGMKNMNSRLDTLLAIFKQEYRKVNSLEKIDDIFFKDYSECYKILEYKKNESLQFLKDVLVK